jgi:formylglycine-generating enzyme required for sulfatase activity
LAEWFRFLFLPTLMLIAFLGSSGGSQPLFARDCRSEQNTITPRVPSLAAAINPHPSEADLELPMPCGGKLILNHVCIPARGYFGDLRIDLGCQDCGRPNQSFMEGKYGNGISGPFTLDDIPDSWRLKLIQLADSSDGRCPSANDPVDTAFYYFISKYEISNFQWKTVMEDGCRDATGPFSTDDPRPKIGISWFEAIEFTRKYTEWLIKNAPEALPGFALNRFGYIRLPTEAEWEYAARGGHRVTEYQLNTEEFFPLGGRPLTDFAVFTSGEAAKPQERLAWIGTKCPNPLGLFDTAGNASEMVLEPFHFSLGYRLHGAAGGFVIKGGSFRKGLAEIMPGRREEQPFFLSDGAFRSADIGVRVVLSGILTPQDRWERFDQQWVDTGLQQLSIQAMGEFSSSGIGMNHPIDPIAEIDRLMNAAGDETQQKKLLYLRNVLKISKISLKKQKAEALRGIIRSAILMAESLQEYATRRKVVINGNISLEKMKAETSSASVIKALERGIARAKESLRMLDAAMDHFTNFYLERVKESQRYPEELIENQLDLITQELSLDEDFVRSLRKRLVLFRRHVSLYKQQAGDVRQEII